MNKQTNNEFLLISYSQFLFRFVLFCLVLLHFTQQAAPSAAAAAAAREHDRLLLLQAHARALSTRSSAPAPALYLPLSVLLSRSLTLWLLFVICFFRHLQASSDLWFTFCVPSLSLFHSLFSNQVQLSRHTSPPQPTSLPCDVTATEANKRWRCFWPNPLNAFYSCLVPCCSR